MPFFRQFQHLLPTGEAWRIVLDKTLRRFFEGLAAEEAAVRLFVELVYLDLFPDSTRQLDAWQRNFGLVAPAVGADQRLQLTGAWQSLGGQSPAYIQDALHAAGFTSVYIHEWWSSGPPYVARDPRNYTTQPRTGTVQASNDPLGPQASNDPGGPQANDFLANQTGYIVNKDLTNRAPPAVPSDPTKWPFFVYFCGETFGDYATIPTGRRAELERKLLQICPTHLWIVLMVVEGEIFDDTFDDTFE